MRIIQTETDECDVGPAPASIIAELIHCTCMVVMLLVKDFTDAISQMNICPNFLHDRRLKGPIVDIKLDNNQISWLAYAADYIQRM